VRVLTNLGIVAILGAIVSASPMVMAAMYAFRPNDRTLALMRPLSLAAVFAALSNTMLGLVNILVYISSRPAPVSLNLFAAQLAETLVVPFLAFGCLSVAWLLVTIGMRKQP
jgi:hypothetical protein